jgi:hypothetical protein
MSTTQGSRTRWRGCWRCGRAMAAGRSRCERSEFPSPRSSTSSVTRSRLRPIGRSRPPIPSRAWCCARSPLILLGSKRSRSRERQSCWRHVCTSETPHRQGRRQLLGAGVVPVLVHRHRLKPRHHLRLGFGPEIPTISASLARLRELQRADGTFAFKLLRAKDQDLPWWICRPSAGASSAGDLRASAPWAASSVLG